MRLLLGRQDKIIKAAAKRNDVTRFFENELSKLGNPNFIDEKMYKRNQEFYKLSKNY